MIPKECKRLAEVDFPIAVVSAHSAREKVIRHGHPSTFHLWWARRPLAACRAMLLALLLPDPCDENCPDDFKTKARPLLANVQGKPGPKDIDLRKAILKFIGDFSNWDLAANPRYLEVGRGLVKAAHGEEAPLVVDPFAGGGSIPLGGAAARMRCLRERPESGRMPHPQSDAGRYSAARVRSWWRSFDVSAKRSKSRLRSNSAQFYPRDSDGVDANCLSVGTDSKMRVAKLRSRNPAGAIVLALQKGRARFRALDATSESAEGQAPALRV